MYEIVRTFLHVFVNCAIDDVLGFVKLKLFNAVYIYVLHRYVERENLSDLLNDAQDFEEHLMMNIVFKMSLQRDVVICMEKVPERSTVQCMHPDTGQMEGSDAELIAVESGDVEVVAVRGE